MHGTLIDVVAIFTGAMIGFFAKSKVLSDKLQSKTIQALALCAFLVGITGILEARTPMICVISIVSGALIGNLLSLEDHLRWCLDKMFMPFAKSPVSEGIVEGFVSFTLMSITGSMAIMGPIADSLSGDLTILKTKALLDLITAVFFAAQFGWVIGFSIVVVFLYQGIFAVMAQMLLPIMTADVIGDMTCVGSLLILLVGFNMLKMTDVKTMNLTPAILLPILFHMIIR